MKQTVFTAIYGQYDTVKKQPDQTVETRFIVISDGHLLWEDQANTQWDFKRDNSNKNLHPRLRAKYHRTHPFLRFPDDYIVIYMDGSCRLLRNDVIETLLNHFDHEADIMTRKHPIRDCIYEEARASKEHKKYSTQDMRGQVEEYRTVRGHPEHYGLSATGLLVMRNSTKMIDFLEARRQENLKRTYQDQLSFDPLIRRMDINRQRIGPEYGDLRHNDMMTFLNPHTHPLE